MKKKILMWVLSAALAVAGMTMSASAAAEDLPQTVRVGLETNWKEKDSIAIVNGAVAFGYEQNGQFMECGILQGNLAAVPAGQNFVRLGARYSSFAQAQTAAAQASGYTAFPGFASPGEWYVYVGGFATSSEMNLACNALGNGATAQPANASRVAVMSGGQMALLFDSAYELQITGYGVEPSVVLGNRTYRGRVEFGRYAGQKLSAVNVVPTEEYLYSVVASEMPSSWHNEALKAQACAARTYASTRIGYHSASGYDLCDTTHCQVYTGKGGEAESTRNAVEGTRGVMIYYANKPIADAVFFSSSGGMTDHSENVWVSTVPYLRGVKELNETSAKQWTTTYTMDELSALLRNRGMDVGTVTSVAIDRVENERVQSLTITGSRGAKTLVKQEITSILSLDSRHFTLANGTVTTPQTTAPTSVSVLENGAVISVPVQGLVAVGADGAVNPIASGGMVYVVGAEGTNAIPTTTAGNTTGTSVVSGANAVTFVGAGWGHGVGMSQHGAKGMAEMGYSYAEILRHYYTGVDVR